MCGWLLCGSFPDGCSVRLPTAGLVDSSEEGIVVCHRTLVTESGSFWCTFLRRTVPSCKWHEKGGFVASCAVERYSSLVVQVRSRIGMQVEGFFMHYSLYGFRAPG